MALLTLLLTVFFVVFAASSEDELPRWTTWENWSTCTQTCGTGFKVRGRRCLNDSNMMFEKASTCTDLWGGDDAVASDCMTADCPSDLVVEEMSMHREKIDDLSREVDGLKENRCDNMVEDAKQSCQMDYENIKAILSGGEDDDSSEPERNFKYEDEQWYQDLMRESATDVIELRQVDFAQGTYRIRQSGNYVLMEDIEFDPETGDFPDIDDTNYPHGQYFLGWFAAITVEADDVFIDLNGYSIGQSKRFNLWMRWFNIIELADRPFINQEGVSPLNTQINDKLFYGDITQSVGSTVSAHRVVIQNGIFRTTAHNGIHGNGNSDIVIRDLEITDFEVAGIQLNGADNVSIERCTVGPNKQDVPALAALSNAIQTARYAKTYIPRALEMYNLTELLQKTISFSDRPMEVFTYEEVFDTLEGYLDQWIDDTLNGNEKEREADELFENMLGLPDGSAMYGIFLHRMGAGVEDFAAQDENYNGPEHYNIDLVDITIQDLKIAPKMIPSLGFADGTLLQGTTRDVVDFLKLTWNPLAGLIDKQYQGNFLVDAYVAMWKLSSEFYTSHILDSECGNFGSNLTSNFADCNVEVMTPGYTGRDTTLIQKKMFGGLALSKQFFEWATIPGTRLSTMLIRQQEIVARKQSRHYITCNHDALFHSNKGLVGLRLEFLGNVTLNRISLKNLENTGDKDHWVCGLQWVETNHNERIRSRFTGSPDHGGPNIRGVSMGKSEGITVKDVSIDNFESLEGDIIGVDISSRVKDRSDWKSGGVALSEFKFGKMKSGSARRVTPISVDQLEQNDAGMSVEDSPTFHNDYNSPKVSIVHGQWEKQNDNPSKFCRTNETICQEIFGEEKLMQLSASFAEYAYSHYGIEVPHDKHWNDEYHFEGGFWGKPTFLAQYVSLECHNHTNCKVNRDAVYYDFEMWIYFTDDYVAHGSFGGQEGWLMQKGSFLCQGYMLCPDCEDQQVIIYYSECPLKSNKVLDLTHPSGPETVAKSGWFILCVAHSSLYGVGRMVGNNFGNDTMGFRSSHSFFDDVLEAPMDYGFEMPTYEGTMMYNDYHGTKGKRPRVQFVTRADGVAGIGHPTNGIDVHSSSNAWTRLHEAGIGWFRRWLKWDDAKIMEYRAECLKFFEEEMGVPNIIDEYYSDPLDNQLDLGTGNNIAPYTVNKALKHRTVAAHNGDDIFCQESRIHEGGFRVSVGRAGINSPRWGFLPFGTVILRGFYVIDCPEKLYVIAFQDITPLMPTQLVHFEVIQKIVSDDFGEGIANGMHFVRETADGKTKFDMGFQFTWSDDWDELIREAGEEES